MSAVGFAAFVLSLRRRMGDRSSRRSDRFSVGLYQFMMQYIRQSGKSARHHFATVRGFLSRGKAHYRNMREKSMAELQIS